MTITYAIPDLHGRIDLLESAIDRVVAHSGGAPAMVVTLGDYVDRGPDNRQVIERLMGWTSDKLKLVALKGNHEAMMLEACNNLAELGWWIGNGGDRTLASYGSDNCDPRNVPSEHLNWIANLPLMHVDQHRVFVHAAVDPTISLHQQSEQTNSKAPIIVPRRRAGVSGDCRTARSASWSVRGTISAGHFGDALCEPPTAGSV